MLILIDATKSPAQLKLADPDNFRGFAVQLQGDGAAAEDAFSTLGRGDGDHVFVDVDALRDLAGERAEDLAWTDSLSQMVAYAGAHGWLDESGRIRAHIERS